MAGDVAEGIDDEEEVRADDFGAKRLRPAAGRDGDRARRCIGGRHRTARQHASVRHGEASAVERGARRRRQQSDSEQRADDAAAELHKLRRARAYVCA